MAELDFSDRAAEAPLDFSARAAAAPSGPQVPILGAGGEELPQPTQTPFDADTAFRTTQPAGSLSLMDQFLETTSVGRVLDAFGEGVQEGWGPERLGLSPESEKWFQDAGLMPGGTEGGDIFWTFKAFNEAMIRPAAAALDVAMRGAGGLVSGLAEGTGQTAAELGAGRETAGALRREVFVAAEVLNILSAGVAGGGLPVPFARPPLLRRPGQTRPDLPQSELPVVAREIEPPVRPTDLFDQAETPAIDKAGNINLDRIAAAEDVKNVIREAALGAGTAAPETPFPIMFHGTTAQFDKFKEGVTYLTSNENAARMWTTPDAGDFRAVPVSAAPQKPLALSELTSDIADRIIERWASNGGDPAVIEEWRGLSKRQSPEAFFGLQDDPALVKAIQSLGYDAALIDKGLRDGERQLAVFDSSNLRIVREDGTLGDPGFTAARRGVISLRETEELADALGMTPADLAKRNIGQAFNAEEITAARTLLVQSADDVRNMALKAAGGSEQDLLAFQQAMTKHAAIQEQVAGLTAEAGRALSSFRIMAQATGEATDLAKVIESFGGRANIEDIARRINQLDTPQQISKFLMDARKATTGDMVMEAWINGLLSGPQTHMVNTVSNGLIALWAVPETALAAGIGRLRGAPDSVMFGEAGARLFGFMQGSLEGVKAGWRVFRSEMPTDPLTKIEQGRQRSIPSVEIQVIDPRTFSFLGRDIELTGKLTLGGKQVRTAGRALMAEDELFKAIGSRQELNAQAYRIASREKLTGKDFAARVAELTANPTKAMLEAARATANYQTFTRELGPLGQAIQKFSNAHVLAKLVIPFVRTPVNIVKYSGERTPLAVFSQQVRDNLGGKNGAVARDTQLARLAMGAAVGATGMYLASQGLITGGGPRDPAQRAMMYLSGWQPYSVRVGEFYYSYGRFEPLGTLLGVSADMYEIGGAMSDPEGADLAALIMGSVSTNLVNKTWAQGPSNLVEAVNDPERYGQQYVQRLAGTVVPTGVAQIARIDDPYLREARSVLDQIQSRVPGLSAGLPFKRDIWGEPIALEGSLGPDIISPIYTSRMSNDPVNRELLALKVFPAKLDRQIRGVDLTDEQYDTYQKVAGRLTKQTLDSMVGAPGWGQLPPFVRIEAITKAVSRTREQARTWMLIRHPDIINTATLSRLNELTGQ